VVKGVIHYYCQQDNATSKLKKGVNILLLKLRGKRVEKGYSQEALAKELDLSTNAYNLKETGKREFKMREINLLLKLLDCTYEDIFLQ
jgi:DNA-binding XRE family transcriptional regulator